MNQRENQDNRFSIKKRLLSFKYAFNGIKKLFITQHNSRIHLTIMLLVIIAGFFFHISKNEWFVVVIVTGLVFAAELFNSAIESIVDLISPEYHKKAENAKDYAAGAVLVAAIISAIAGLIIFAPKLLAIL
jgi:diacylglycerol kinase (ATP)